MIALVDLIVLGLFLAALVGGAKALRNMFEGRGIGTRLGFGARDAASGTRAAAGGELAELRARVESLETRLAERDRAVDALREELAFVSRMLEGPRDGSDRQPPS